MTVLLIELIVNLWYNAPHNAQPVSLLSRCILMRENELHSDNAKARNKIEIEIERLRRKYRVRSAMAIIYNLLTCFGTLTKSTFFIGIECINYNL